MKLVEGFGIFNVCVPMRARNNDIRAGGPIHVGDVLARQLLPHIANLDGRQLRAGVVRVLVLVEGQRLVGAEDVDVGGRREAGVMHGRVVVDDLAQGVVLVALRQVEQADQAVGAGRQQRRRVGGVQRQLRDGVGVALGEREARRRGVAGVPGVDEGVAGATVFELGAGDDGVAGGADLEGGEALRFGWMDGVSGIVSVQPCLVLASLLFFHIQASFLLFLGLLYIVLKRKVIYLRTRNSITAFLVRRSQHLTRPSRPAVARMLPSSLYVSRHVTLSCARVMMPSGTRRRVLGSKMRIESSDERAARAVFICLKAYM